jgi:DNA polymerase III epsilon subunit-like protein
MIFGTLVIDCETGGFNPNINGLCSVSIKVFNTDEKVKTWYIKPINGYIYEEEALKINNLSLEWLNENGISLRQFAKEFRLYLLSMSCKYKTDKFNLLGHNVTFDIGFIKHVFSIYQNDNPFKGDKTALLHYHFKDTMILSEYFKDIGLLEVDSVSLSNVYKYLFQGSLDFHKSDIDVLACEKIYKYYLNLYFTNN